MKEIIEYPNMEMIECREPLTRILNIYCGDDSWCKGSPLDKEIIEYLVKRITHLLWLMNGIITEEQYKSLESRM